MAQIHFVDWIYVAYWKIRKLERIFNIYQIFNRRHWERILINPDNGMISVFVKMAILYSFATAVISLLTRWLFNYMHLLIDLFDGIGRYSQ